MGGKKDEGTDGERGRYRKTIGDAMDQVVGIPPGGSQRLLCERRFHFKIINSLNSFSSLKAK